MRCMDVVCEVCLGGKKKRKKKSCIELLNVLHVTTCNYTFLVRRMHTPIRYVKLSDDLNIFANIIEGEGKGAVEVSFFFFFWFKTAACRTKKVGNYEHNPPLMIKILNK